jgi:hypothetical protein
MEIALVVVVILFLAVALAVLFKEINDAKIFMVKETGENFTKVTQSLLDNSRNASKDFDSLKESVQGRVNDLIKTVDAKLSEISGKVE